nr:reverse transcriptase domain-containing protein [Tanacetum cinerariifolium]
MMSSPDHPASNLEDAFSSNFPNYLPLASPDYVPASPGKTYSISSNSFGIVPLASPTLSLFHDDPYIKVLQPFYTENSLIPPPITTPPSSMPNPQEFFLLEDLLSPKKQGPNQSSSFTMPPKRPSTSAAPAMTQAAISNCTEHYKVKFATGTLTEEALSWWNSFAQPIAIKEAYKITWVKFKKFLIKKYYPRTEELATLCPTMVSDSEKMMEAFIEGLPQSIKGNVTASKPQTLEETINTAQRLMDQVTKHTPVQVSSDHKRVFKDIRTFNNNNYRNITTNNCYNNHQP